MDSLSTLYVKDASGTVEIATTTDDRDQATDALHYSPEQTEMQKAQQQTTPAPRQTTPVERLEEARRMIAHYDRDTFKASAGVYTGVLQICADHENGFLLAHKIATDPKLRSELLKLPAHLAMARAGVEADKLTRDRNPYRQEIEWGKL